MGYLHWQLGGVHLEANFVHPPRQGTARAAAAGSGARRAHGPGLGIVIASLACKICQEGRYLIAGLVVGKTGCKLSLSAYLKLKPL